MGGESEKTMMTFPRQAQVPIRNGVDYAAMVAENLRLATMTAQEQLGPVAELVAYSHCYTMVPSSIAGAGVLLFTLVATFQAYLTPEKLAALRAEQAMVVGK